MSYRRVLPRDLFNEANLLKCIARLWLHLEQVCPDGRVHITPDECDAFEIHQDWSDGSISVKDMRLHVQGQPAPFIMFRPLNSRAFDPLYIKPSYGDVDVDPIRVFAEDNDTDMSPEFIALIRRQE